MLFAGKDVVITGGTGALGRAVAKAFLEQGASVHVSYLEDEELATLPHELIENNRLEMRRLDLTNEQEVVCWFKSMPRMDILVNVAGGFAMGPIAETRLKDWEFMFDMNLKTTFLCCREALKRMNPQETGRIINVGAFAATQQNGGMGSYTTSKAGVLHLTGVLAEETLSNQITVNAVLPTIMDTPGNRKAMPEADPTTWVSVGDVARTILFLAEPTSTAITGALIPLRGHC